MNRLSVLAVLCSAALSAACVVSLAGPMGNPAANPPSTQPSAEPIANKLCPVTKDPVDPKVKTFEYKGKRIGFCCESCIKDFKKDPEKYMKDLK